MKITHTVIPGADYVNINTLHFDLSVLTKSGTPDELLARAAELEIEASRKLRRAEILRTAATEMMK